MRRNTGLVVGCILGIGIALLVWQMNRPAENPLSILEVEPSPEDWRGRPAIKGIFQNPYRNTTEAQAKAVYELREKEGPALWKTMSAFETTLSSEQLAARKRAEKTIQQKNLKGSEASALMDKEMGLSTEQKRLRAEMREMREEIRDKVYLIFSASKPVVELTPDRE